MSIAGYTPIRPDAMGQWLGRMNKSVSTATRPEDPPRAGDETPTQEFCVYAGQIATRGEVIKDLSRDARLSHLFCEQLAWSLPWPTDGELETLPRFEACP